VRTAHKQVEARRSERRTDSISSKPSGGFLVLVVLIFGIVVDLHDASAQTTAEICKQVA
jgi:hypothetical protein